MVILCFHNEGTHTTELDFPTGPITIVDAKVEATDGVGDTTVQIRYKELT